MNRRQALKGGIATTLATAAPSFAKDTDTTEIGALIQQYDSAYARYSQLDDWGEQIEWTEACHRLTRCERALMHYRPTNAEQARLKVEALKKFINTDFLLSEDEIAALLNGMLWEKTNG